MTGDQKFEEWYEKYERDGAELLLYNTIDLEAAYLSGREGMKLQCLTAVEGADDCTDKVHDACMEIKSAITALE